MFLKDLERFIEEDLGHEYGSCEIVPEKEVKANIIVKEDGIIAGIEEANRIFRYFSVDTEPISPDGSAVKKGDIVFHIRGNAVSILKSERLALNFLGRMSGIATLTSEFVKRSGSVRIASTRKTTPGFREFEKKAVFLGGGDPHRFDLSGSYMIKDNHIKIMGLINAIDQAKRLASFTKKIEVEVESIEDAYIAAEQGADIIMFDNMSPAAIKKGVQNLKKKYPGIILEASGGISLDNVADYTAAGVDVISLGALTHSSKWLDFSLEVC